MFKKAQYHDAVYDTCYFILSWKIPHKWPNKKLGTMMLCMTYVISEITHHLASSCIVLQHLASSCIALHHLASSCIILHHLASSCIILHCLASSCIVLHHLASSCIVLHHLASSCTNPITTKICTPAPLMEATRLS